MIPEPFTYAIAGFAVLTTLLNIVASTLENFKDRKDKFTNCAVHLRGLEQDIIFCNIQFRNCLEKWSNEAEDTLMAENDCMDLLGAENHRFLKTQVSLIIQALVQFQQDMAHVLLGVRLESDPTAGEDEFWIDDREQLEADRAYCRAWTWTTGIDVRNVFASEKRRAWKARAERMLRSNRRFLISLKYTFWNGEATRQRVDRLIAAIERLDRFTTLIDERVPNPCIAPNGSFSKKLACAAQLSRDWHQFSLIMSKISKRPYSVIPRSPDREGRMGCFQHGDDLSASVFVEQRDSQGVPLRQSVIYVAHSISSTLPENELIDHISSGNCKGPHSQLNIPCPTTVGRNMRQLYKDVAELSKEEQAEWQSWWRVERAETALSLLTWIILLWKTPWTRCISTDHLWRYPSRGTGIQVSILPIGASCKESHGCHERFAVPLGRAPDGEHLHGKSVPEEIRKARVTLLTLAVTLAEIALMTPCSVHFDEYGRLHFKCQHHVYDESGMLNGIQRKMGIPYRKIVELCLTRWRSSVCRLITALDMVKFWGEVVTPLERWVKDVVLPHSEVTKTKTWRPCAAQDPRRFGTIVGAPEASATLTRM